MVAVCKFANGKRWTDPVCCSQSYSHIICILQEAFDTLDKDDSGFIETAEVRSLFDKVYDGKAPNFEVDTFVQFFDTNKDGKISWSEFEQGLGDAAQQQPSNYAFNLLPCAEEDDDTPYIEPEVSGKRTRCIARVVMLFFTTI